MGMILYGEIRATWSRRTHAGRTDGLGIGLFVVADFEVEKSGRWTHAAPITHLNCYDPEVLLKPWAYRLIPRHPPRDERIMEACTRITRIWNISCQVNPTK